MQYCRFDVRGPRMPTKIFVDKLRSCTLWVFVWQGDEVTKLISTVVVLQWIRTWLSSNVSLFHRKNKLPPGFARMDAIKWLEVKMKVKPFQLDSAVEFSPWGCFNQEFLASFSGLSRLRVFHLVLSWRVESQKWKKSLKSHQIRKITTQQARTHHVYKVRPFLLRISANTYLLESITWILIQILYVHCLFDIILYHMQLS